jgi:hypothetical protein
MANTKKVPEEQIPMEEIKETKPADNPTPAKEPENPVKDNDVKEEKKTILRKVADWADAKDQKNKQKKADKLHKQEQKKAEKEAKKTQKPEATLGSKLKKAALIGGGAVVAIGGGLLAYEMSKPNSYGSADYVDNGTPTTYIPEQTQSAPVEETSTETAVVTETNSSETAGTVVETTSNE